MDSSHPNGNIKEIALDRLADAIVIVDRNGKLSHVNPAGLQLFGMNGIRDTIQLRNAGLIDANVSGGELEIDTADQVAGVASTVNEGTMRASNGVVAKAARLLNMRRTTLVEKIGKYNIA